MFRLASRIDINARNQLNVERTYCRYCYSTVSSCTGSSFPCNFLGCLELISRFEPLLSEHLAKHGNAGKGIPNYLSSTICDEFTQLMSDKVPSSIVSKIKKVASIILLLWILLLI